MSETTKKKILVVEDEQETLNHICNLLQRSNFEVFSTTKGQEAVGLAREKRPDLIILDIVIPDKSGSEVAAELAQIPSTSNIPIIFLTGILTKNEELSVKKSGRHTVMAKPVTGREILDMINRVLSGQS